MTTIRPTAVSLHVVVTPRVWFELLAREAARQGVDGVNRAQQVGRLLDEQVRPGLPDVEEPEARDWYDDHRFLFDRVRAADLNSVVVSAAAEIERVVAELGQSDGPPDALAGSPSVVDEGRIAFSIDGEEPDIMIGRLMNVAEMPGAVSYDRDPGSGDWWIVETEGITLVPPF